MSWCVILFACLLLFVSSSNSYVVPTNNEDVRSSGATPTCTTPACKATAAALISAMNTSVDPCKDFYQYACGGWIAKNPLPSSRSFWSVASVLVRQVASSISSILMAKNDPKDPTPVNQARDFYAACMNTARLETVGIRPLLDILSSFGGWPMTLKHWNPKAFSWQTATAAITRLYNTGVLLAVDNYFDQKNSSRNRIYVDQATFILPRSELVDPKSAKDNIAAYTAFITGAAKAISDAQKSSATDAQISTDVAAMLKFEYALANITTADEDRRNATRMYNPLTVTQLQKWTDSVRTTETGANINWPKLLNNIYNLGAGINIPNTETVIVVETGYLKKLVALLNRTPPRTIANYVHWNIVYQLASKTNQRMKDLLFQFRKVTEGVSQPTPLNITCADATNNFLGFAVSYKYVASYFDPAAKNETLTMVKNLQTAFKSLVDNASWMDSATKAIAKDKANNMVANVGYPDWMLNKTALQNYYGTLSTSKMDYFGSFRNASAYLKAENFKKLRGTDSRRDRSGTWDMFPDIVNAYYDASYNNIVFPAAILQLPFFTRGRLAALNYGGIGSIIGHEITHGFDDQGRQYDKNGNIADWWTKATTTNYLNRAQCFINQYGNYTIPNGNHLNGVNTQGENIADNGGLREAFQAYKIYVAANGVEPKLPGLEQFTSEQLFFLSFANNYCGSQTLQNLQNQIQVDVHSPDNFRVIGSLSNNADFVSQFKCPSGSPMNRANKCTLW